MWNYDRKQNIKRGSSIEYSTLPKTVLFVNTDTN